MIDKIANHDACPGAISFDEWMAKSWLEVRVENKVVRVFPLWPIQHAIRKHDIHHVLTGYSTSFKGEAELAAWELSTGGCHLNLIFWIDRFGGLLIGLAMFPRSTFTAFLRGIGSRNTFSMNLDEILELDVADLRDRLQL